MPAGTPALLAFVATIACGSQGKIQGVDWGVGTRPRAIHVVGSGFVRAGGTPAVRRRAARREFQFSEEEC
jgi:hypothetical protein